MWKVYTLAQLEQQGIVQLGRGKVISKKDLSRIHGSYPVYSSSKMGDGKFGQYGEYMFDEELITWSVDGGGRLFHRHKHKFSITNVTGFLRILQPTIVDYKYLFYCLVFLHSKVNFDWVKKAHPSVLRREYNHILLPPLAEQQRIAAKLDAAFAEIDKAMAAAERKRQQTDKLKQSIFRSELSADDASWKAVKLGDVCTIINGGTPKTSKAEYWGAEIQWLTPKDMGKLEERYVSKTARQITKAGLDNSSAKLVPPQSIILSCRAPIGHVAINTVSMSFNQGCKGLVPSSSATAEYLYYFLLFSKQLLNDLGSGTTFKEISSKRLSSVELKLPLLTEQRRIAAKLDAAFAETAALTEAASKQITNYRALKSALLACELQSEAA